MPQTTTPPVDRAAQATKRADLGFTRDRLREHAQKFPRCSAAVTEMAAAVERAKLAADLRPNDKHARELAEHDARRLDTAILERDELVASIERLRKHESTLANELAAMDNVDHTKAQAEFRVALEAAIRNEAAAAQRWAGLILLESELVGRQIADLGQLMREYLSGTYSHSALSGPDNAGVRAARGEAARMRAAFEGGEALP